MIEYAIALVRHAFAENGPDPSLSDYGRQQARELGAALGQTIRPPQLMLASPALRATQTAEILGATADGWPIPMAMSQLAVGQATAALADQPSWPSQVVLVTHEDIIGAIVTALVGHARLGYGRASATLLARRGSGTWHAEHRTFEQMQDGPT